MKKVAELETFIIELEKHGYQVTDRFIAAQTFLALKDRGRTKGLSSILFDGPPGTGKTFIAEVLVEMLGAELVFFQFTPGVTREALIYDLDLCKVVQGMSGEKLPEKFSDMLSLGVLPSALKKSLEGPVVLVLDEIDKGHPSIDSFTLDYFQRGEINDPHLGRIQGKPENLLVVVTKNDERQLSEPLMRRLRRVYLEYPDPVTELSMVKKAVPLLPENAAKSLITSSNKLRALSKEGKIMKAPSTPEVIRCAEDLLSIPNEFYGEIILSWLLAYHEDHKHFENELHLKKKFTELLA